MKQVKKGVEAESVLEKKHVYLHSLLRRIEHIRTFGQSPQTSFNISLPTQLRAVPENRKILSVLGELFKNPHSFFPTVVDHWTSLENVKSILSENALMGNYALKKAKIDFESNVLCEGDKDNLDGNVICFAPGRFIDPYVFYDKNSPLPTVRKDRVLFRLNVHRFSKKGKLNSFFKITDLYGPYFTKELVVSPGFTITVSRNMNNTFGYNPSGKVFPISVSFNFKGQRETVSFSVNESLFYGDISEINCWCLLLLFKALDKCKTPSLVKSIYEYISDLDRAMIEYLIIEFAKSLTPISEYNIRGILEFTPGIINEIHFDSEGKTYDFNEYTDQEYSLALKKIIQPSLRAELSSRHEKIIPERRDFDKESTCEIYGEKLLYNRKRCEPRYTFSRTELKYKPSESANVSGPSGKLSF